MKQLKCCLTKPKNVRPGNWSLDVAMEGTSNVDESSLLEE